MTVATRIIMVEDDVGHAVLIQKNIRRSGFSGEIIHFTNGTAALEDLFGQRGIADRDRLGSTLILLDLNLPDMSGIEVLRRVKQDETLKPLPVIMLTTTDDKLEIQRCYDLGCNVYITKPVIYQNFAEAVKQLGLFLSVIQIPATIPA